MVDSNMPLTKISEICNSMDDLLNLLGQCKIANYDSHDIPLSGELLQEAISKLRNKHPVSRCDIQRLLRVGYPEAARIYDLIETEKARKE